jgi:parallel beta-helix repeat protein
VANNLDASQGLTKHGDCIDISAPFVQLNVNSFTVIGNGTGDGIRVLPEAHNTIIEGANPGASTQAVVNGWNVGVMVGAHSTVVEHFNPIGGTGKDGDTKGNVGAGIVIQGASDCTVDGITSAYNGTGALVANSNHVRIFNFIGSQSDGSGIQVQNSSIGTFMNTTATNNGLYGLVLLNSDQNQVSNFAASDNGAAGISLGCDPHGPVSCPTSRQPSSRNKVSNGGANTNGRAGVVINAGSSNNQVTAVSATGNNKGGSDLSDQNANCDKNQWFTNTFGSADPSCIH